MKSAGRVIGHFKKDKFESDFVTEWNKALTAAGLAKVTPMLFYKYRSNYISAYRHIACFCIIACRQR
jgi:hypothetical protein